jgi:polyisoprenoid-binding protein YceI
MLKLLSLVAAAPAALLLYSVAPAAPAAAPTSPAAAADTYQVDGGHSSVVFKVKHAGTAWFYGTFEGISGQLTVDEADPGKSSIEIEIAAESVDSNSEGRDKHILGPDFLSAKEFPKIGFESTSVKDVGEGNLEVTGTLDFRGIQKPVTAQVEHIGKGEMRGKQIVGYEARFSFKRSEFGASYGVAEGALGDEVHMIVSLEAAKQ